MKTVSDLTHADLLLQHDREIALIMWREINTSDENVPPDFTSQRSINLCSLIVSFSEYDPRIVGFCVWTFSNRPDRYTRLLEFDRGWLGNTYLPLPVYDESEGKFGWVVTTADDWHTSDRQTFGLLDFDEAANLADERNALERL
ncbi:MAG: hypothetical protein CMF22_11925 [Idiomarinaceae bacterium]|nr:hypothetical protein [Idiomarinaceae bacterium]|tara:strand:+ start:23491 stop:23922 length:432 start_codon:yes stop_codon:yes gene_type:complete